MTDAAIIYRTHFDAIRALPKDQRVDAYEALISYCLNDEIPEDGLPLAILTMAKPVLDKWKKKREAGASGGSANGKQTVSKLEANDKQPESKCEAKEKVKDKEKDVSKDTSQKKRFVKPTAAEVRAYCLEKCYNVDAENFVDYYDSNGWMVGKSAMKDWKACVRRWAKNAEQKQTQPKPVKQNRFNNFDQRGYDFGNLEQMLLENQRARDG